MTTPPDTQTDLDLLDRYCETCLAHVDPFLINDIRRRGLYSCIQWLPRNVAQAKAMVLGKLAKTGRATNGRYVGDPEIERIADLVARMESLRTQLVETNMAESHRVEPLLSEMTDLNQRLSTYYQ